MSCLIGNILCSEGISVGISVRVWASLAGGGVLIRVVVALGVSVAPEVLFYPELLIVTPKCKIYIYCVEHINCLRG